MPGSPPSDAELLAAHRAGDPEAFGRLVDRYRPALWGLALHSLGGDRHEAADAVQEALLAAYRRAGSFRGESSVRTWLGRIVVNACIDRIRRERLRRTVPLPRDLPAGGPDVAARVATRLAVDEALALLPVPQRLAVVLVDVQGRPTAEAAAILGVPPGTVKSRCARGRARLAELLGHLREET